MNGIDETTLKLANNSYLIGKFEDLTELMEKNILNTQVMENSIRSKFDNLDKIANKALSTNVEPSQWLQASLLDRSRRMLRSMSQNTDTRVGLPQNSIKRMS